MKISKQLKRISLILLGIMIALALCKVTYGADGSSLAGTGGIGQIVYKKIGGMDGVFTGGGYAIVGFITFGMQQFALMIFMALQALTWVITGIAGEGHAGAIGDVVFNRCELTSANFFPEVWIGDAPKYGAALGDIVSSIRTYYNVIRNLSIAILLFILIYVGIRMAISTTASDEAKYKKMLKDWAVSLVLVFMLHFIMIITFFINNSLVYALSGLDTGSGAGAWTGLRTAAAIPGYGWPDLIVYGAFVVGTLAFVLMYIKRTIVLGFLIVISPLITITYSIDKMGDGKSQALNAWLKEFIFTVIVQPFHCIIYLVFYDSIMRSVTGITSELDLGKMIFAVGSALFMLKAEGIIKKIFGVQPSSIGDALGTGAMALTMATSMFKGSGKKLNKNKGEIKSMDPSKNVKTTKNKGVPTDAAQQAATNAAAGAGAGAGTAAGAGASAGTGASQNVAGTANANMPSGISNAISNTGANAESQSKAAGFIKRKISNHISRHGGLKGATIDFLKEGARRGTTAAGFIAGATVGDFKTAASTATAATGIARNVSDDLEYRRAERVLEDNQRFYADAYEDFADEYRLRNGMDSTDEEIRAEIGRILETNGLGLEDWQQEIYDKADQLSTGAEIMGYDDGADYVLDTSRLAAEGVVKHSDNYVPKRNRRNSGNSNSNGNNNRYNYSGNNSNNNNNGQNA